MPLPDPRRSAAILIGTDAYDRPELADLPAIANNLQGLRSALGDTAAGGFSFDNCVTIRNPSSTRHISDQLLQVAEKAQDTLLVYIAGHGLPDMSSGELYLALRDTDVENLRFTALRYDDLRQLFLYSPRFTAAKRIVILDCCYSGRALPTMSEDQLGGMVDIDGVYIMRVIVYRDFLADAATDALTSTEFFTLQYNRSVTLPDEIERFDAFMRGIKAAGGGPGDRESGLEALAEAIRSQWVIGATKRRQIIVVWTDGGTHDLAGWRPSEYPDDMPGSFDDLTEMWEGDQYMDRTAKRLILFAPDTYAWTNISDNWENVVHYVARAGEGLVDKDYRSILHAIASSV